MSLGEGKPWRLLAFDQLRAACHCGGSPRMAWRDGSMALLAAALLQSNMRETPTLPTLHRDVQLPGEASQAQSARSAFKSFWGGGGGGHHSATFGSFHTSESLSQSKAPHLSNSSFGIFWGWDQPGQVRKRAPEKTRCCACQTRDPLLRQCSPTLASRALAGTMRL